MVENVSGLIQTHRTEPLQKYLLRILQSLVVNSRRRRMMNLWLLLLDRLLLLGLLSFRLEIVGQFSLVSNARSRCFSLILRICLAWLLLNPILLATTTTTIRCSCLICGQLRVHLLSMLHLVIAIVVGVRVLVGRMHHGV